MSYSKYLELSAVKINDPFWNKITELVRTVVIPYQYEALHDRIDGAEKSYCIENFIKAANADGGVTYPVDRWCYSENDTPSGASHGWVFQDSDAYKWLEAAAYSLTNHPDPELEEKADGVIDLICAAQLENGYLDTLYIINDRSKIFTNLRDFHELYCFGHLAEAGVAYYKATGKRKLLDAAMKFADLICETFGENEGQKRGYGGHEIAELALVKLFETTGYVKYLRTAKFLVDERGKKPYYFDLEHSTETEGEGYFYNQAHRQPRYQTQAVGHSVRGVYLYSGMADVAKYCNDGELYFACKRLWDNIEQRKMYITGGIGSTVHGEAFSFDYDLPNDLAYSETCASIGLIFFARRMAEFEADSRYSAVAERALYNAVLASMAEDGKSFFYVNPLEVNPLASRVDERKRHIKPTRQKWFSCACCPPNLARLISSLGEYCYSENENTLFINQFIGSTAESALASVSVDSDYAESGKVRIRISPKKPMLLAVRIPEWSSYKGEAVKNGYEYFRIDKESELAFDFKAEARLIKCSNLVRSNIGKAALQRGPFIYCLEGADNGENLQLISIDKNAEFTKDGEYITADGYRETPDSKLYYEYKMADKTPIKIKFLPYYRWGNRGENEMIIYLRINN